MMKNLLKLSVIIIGVFWMTTTCDREVTVETCVEENFADSIVNPYNITIADVPIVKPVQAKVQYSPYELAVLFIKYTEDFKQEAFPDAKQISIGWGTKSHMGEVIDLEEANRRFKADFTKRFNTLSKTYPKISRPNRLILTSLFYNVGSVGVRMDKALRNNDMEAVKRILPEYNKVLGKTHPAILARRKAEVELLNTPEEDRPALVAKLKAGVRKKIIAEKYR